MPCEFNVVNLREREREQEQERQRSEEKKRQEVLRKKKALLTALGELGYDVSVETVDGGQTFITGTQE